MENRKALWVALVALFVSATTCPVQENPQTINVWMTTDNQTKKLEPQPALSFSSSSSSGANTIFVDESQKYQTIEGFGASFTDSAAYLLNQKVPTSQLDALMISLFDRTNGIGVSFVRNPMGASDLALRSS